MVGLANHTLLIRRDGTELSIDGSAAPIKDVDGKILGAVLVFRDVTDRRRAEQEQQKSRLELLEKVLELEQFEQAVVGRELKMMSLEQEIEALREEVHRLKRSPPEEPSQAY